MADKKIGQAALSLYQLVGAPLYALIQAETYAASATADFIEHVGFEKQKGGNSTSHENDLGKLRTLAFQQERRTTDGQAASYKVEVPLLSILPIPALQIKEADLEFYVKIIDMVSPKENATKPKATPKSESQHVPVPAPPMELKALLGRAQPNASRGPASGLDAQVFIKVKVVQADPPAGLGRLFNLLEQSISSTKIE